MQPLIDWCRSNTVASTAAVLFVLLLVSRFWDKISNTLAALAAKAVGTPGSATNTRSAAGQPSREQSSDQAKTQLGFDANRPQIAVIEFDMSNIEHVRIYHTTKELIAKCPDKAISLVQQSQPAAQGSSA